MVLWATRIGAIVIVAVLIARRWQQAGAFVTGTDAGNWFALGRGLVGDGGRSTAAGYPPLVPLVMHLGRLMFDPMLVAKVVQIGSILAIIAACYVVAASELPHWIGLSVALSVGLSSTVSEPLAYGGYPQNYCVALLLFVTLALSRYLSSGSHQSLVLAGLTLTGAALTHHTFFIVTCLTCGLIWLLWLTTRPDPQVIKARTIAASAVGVIAFLAFLPTYLVLWNVGYEPPLNPSGFNLNTSLQYAIREAPWIWVPVVAAGLVYLVLSRRRWGSGTTQIAIATITVSGAIFLATGESRVLALLVVGVALGFGLLLNALWTETRQSALSGVPLTLALAVPLLLWARSDATAGEYFRYYRMADQPLLNVTEFVDEYEVNGTVVVRADRRDWPLGWWFEGLTDEEIASGSNEKWLAIPEERDRAALVEEFFERPLTTQDLVNVANQHNVHLLVFRKWEWIGWQRWLAESNPSVTVIYDDDEFMVLDVSRP